MSLWIYKKEKNGKKILWQIDFDPMVIMVVIAMLAALIGPVFFQDPSIIIKLPFVLLGTGLVCLIISKMSLYKRGIWFSFGPKFMSKGFAKLYKAAYVLIGFGGLILLLLLNAVQRA
jgi:hypothetical protein